mgnify:CR=1 FL=1
MTDRQEQFLALCQRFEAYCAQIDAMAEAAFAKALIRLVEARVNDDDEETRKAADAANKVWEDAGKAKLEMGLRMSEEFGFDRELVERKLEEEMKGHGPH